MLNSVRARLTLWYTGVLALVLAVFAAVAYLFLTHTFGRRTDDWLAEMARAFNETVRAEEQEIRDGREAAPPGGWGGMTPATAAVLEAVDEYQFKDCQLLVYSEGQLTAASSGFVSGRKDSEEPLWTLPQISAGLSRMNGEVATRPDAPPVYATLTEGEDQFRAVARALPAGGHSYTLVVLRSLEEQDKLLEGASNTLIVGVPLALLLASLGGYFLARKSLAPVVLMSETAERIGAENLHERLPVANARDELGRLAATFNRLLARLNESFERQRRFMADASHELRTPVSIVRGEAEIALSREGRAADDLRESLSIVHDEGRRLTLIVEDLFTLARADATGQHPLKLKRSSTRHYPRPTASPAATRYCRSASMVRSPSPSRRASTARMRAPPYGCRPAYSPRL